jgi:hypothetical protein
MTNKTRFFIVLAFATLAFLAGANINSAWADDNHLNGVLYGVLIASILAALGFATKVLGGKK